MNIPGIDNIFLHTYIDGKRMPAAKTFTKAVTIFELPNRKTVPARQ